MIAMSPIEHGHPKEISNLIDRGETHPESSTSTNIKNKSLLNLSARVQNLMNASLTNEESEDSVDGHEPAAEEE
tara:strand:+ start:699 stop:920 length:222 start_codon:yes stop_codon:yes gene_type:complete